MPFISSLLFLLLFWLLSWTTHCSSISDETTSDADQSPSGQFKTYEIKLNEGQRLYGVYVPSTSPSTSSWPVVVGIHGAMGTYRAQVEMSQMNHVANRHSFLAVYPNGSGVLGDKLLTFNAGPCCAYAYRKKIDDVTFIRSVIEDLAQRYPIDRRRIYVTGMSNGAMMSYRLACDLSDVFAAAAPVAGAIESSDCKLKRPVPILHIHGLKDQYYPFAGEGSTKRGIREPHPPVEKVIGQWVVLNKSFPTPTVEATADFIKETYPASSKDSAPVVLYKLPEGGHTWPGGKNRDFLGAVVKTFPASEIIWEFFSKHSL